MRSLSGLPPDTILEIVEDEDYDPGPTSPMIDFRNDMSHERKLEILFAHVDWALDRIEVKERKLGIRKDRERK